MLEVALGCIARGWFVFPCKPGGKEPIISGGFKAASYSENDVRRWWTRWPDANVGIATGASGLTVLDIDTGLKGVEDFRAFLDEHSIPTTYAVRTGRRPGYGVQMYFEGTGVKSIPWTDGWDDTIGGDIRGATGYVMAAGCLHPSGERYEVLEDHPIAPVPAFVRDLKSAAKEQLAVVDGPITAHRNSTLTSIAGKLRNAGLSAAALEVALLQVNADRCVPPLDDQEIRSIATHAAAWKLPEAALTVTLGGVPRVLEGASTHVQDVQADWRERYHTLEDLQSVKPATFMVEGVLHEDSIVGLAGYAGDRKSIVSLNLAASCVTGTPFMGRFAVTNPPKRVLYLCPEMGLRELAERVRGLDMAAHVGKTLFFRTLDKQGEMRLPDMAAEELDGALVILDTAIRFLEGSENDPQDMARFAEQLFRLRSGGATVWVLFHSSKASAGQDLTLQNAVRGSSELAAMLSACWATRLIDPQDRFGSNSRLFPLKTREFEAFPFEFEVDRATASCRIVGDPAPEMVLRDRKDDAARNALAEILRSDPLMGVNKICDSLRLRGVRKGAKWVMLARAGMAGNGVSLRA